MKQAWLEHNPNMDNADADCLAELGEIINDTEAEVAKTLQTSYAVLWVRGTAMNPKRTKQPQ